MEPWLVIIICTIASISLILLLLKPIYFYLVFIFLLAAEGIPAFENFSYTKVFGMMLASFVVLRLLIMREKINLHDRFYVFFLLFLAGALVSVFVAQDYSTSFDLLITYFSLGLLFFVTRYFLTSSKKIDKTLTVLILSILVVYLIVEFTGISDNSASTNWRIAGGFGNPNRFASVVLAIIPLVLYRTIHSPRILKLFFYISLGSFVILLIYTGSRGGILGFLGLTGVLVYHYGSRRIRPLLFFLLTVVVILYFVAPDEFWYRASSIADPESEMEVRSGSIVLRILLYKTAFQIFLDHPWIGVGLGNFRYMTADYGLNTSLAAHNTYLEILAGGGLITFIPFGLILTDCARKLKLNKNYDAKSRDLIICLRASFISLLITALFYSADHVKIFWFLFALISSVYYTLRNNETIMIDKPAEVCSSSVNSIVKPN